MTWKEYQEPVQGSILIKHQLPVAMLPCDGKYTSYFVEGGSHKVQNL